MSLRLLKVEEGFLKGEVLYHALVTKSEEEKVLLKKKIQEKEETKIRNKKIQDANVKKKEDLKEDQLLKKRSKNPAYKKNEEEGDQKGDEEYDFLV